MAELIVAFQHNDDGELLHRIGNFYEDVYRAFRNSAEASVLSDIDALRHPLRMNVRTCRKVSRVATQIEQLLAEHRLGDLATLTTN